MTKQRATNVGWRRVPLIEVCDVIQGQSPPGETYNTDGVGLPFFQGKAEFGDYYPTPVKWCAAPKKVAETGDVLISIRAPVGPTNLCPAKSCIGRGLAALRPKDGVPSKYILYAIRASADELVRKATGSTFEAVSGKDLRAHEISLAPVDEQPRIVAEIEKQFTRLEAGVAGLRRVQANLKRYRAAVLKAACEGKLVPTEAELARQRRTEKVAAASRRWPLQENQSRDGSATQEDPDYETGAQLLERILRERRQKWSGKGKYKEPAQPDTAKLPALPVGWVWTTMDVVIISGPQNGIYLPKASYGRGCPILRIDDFQEGWVRDRDELNMVTGDPETLKVYQLRVGDLVINRVNSPSHLGKCLVVRDSLVPAVFESNMMRAVLSGLIHTRYVEFYLRSVDGRSRLNSNAKWAVNQASINQEDVKSTALPLPPVPEQERIVAEVERRLSVVEEIEAVVTANLQRATRLRQSMLQRAFSEPLLR